MGRVPGEIYIISVGEIVEKLKEGMGGWSCNGVVKRVNRVNLGICSGTIRERINKMRIFEAKEKLEEIISVLSENRLKEVIDFANYLRTKEEVEELFGMQVSSKGYIDWLSSENDIYDEVFKDEIKQR